MDTTTIEQYIRAGESLKVEFKEEQRESLSDREIYEAVVCLANADGGILLIGVENDGRLTARDHVTALPPIRIACKLPSLTTPNHLSTRECLSRRLMESPSSSSKLILIPKSAQPRMAGRCAARWECAAPSVCRSTRISTRAAGVTLACSIIPPNW